ncbi:hypothetical protein MNBD_GAMMA25-1474 [hydrothermal vent metagenome]|uniref:Uncharacterized protein n=1 Tax=hydrothermal vent metagenome TaxID=652676 RepID=A0A3B1BI34_9ZZZZ
MEIGVCNSKIHFLYLSWVFDFSGYGIDQNTVINSASLSITARGVDRRTDPVRVENNLFLGNLTPGSSGTTQFDLLGIMILITTHITITTLIPLPD